MPEISPSSAAGRQREKGVRGVQWKYDDGLGHIIIPNDLSPKETGASFVGLQVLPNQTPKQSNGANRAAEYNIRVCVLRYTSYSNDFGVLANTKQ